MTTDPNAFINRFAGAIRMPVAITEMTFTVTGTPRPQPRGRHIKGRVVSTVSAKTRLWRELIMRAAHQAAENVDAATLTGPVQIDMVFSFAPPAGQEQRIGEPHTHRPDKDNLEKAVLDALVKAKVIADDSSVTTGSVRKLWDRRAGLRVVVKQLAPAQAAGEGQDRRGELGRAEDAPDWLEGAGEAL